MKQQTLAMAADAQSCFEQHRKPTRRDEFLKTMDALVPWAALCEEIAPHYPKAGNGRPPIGLQRMLRIHFIQHWFNLADLACEDALYDGASLRRFVGIDLGREPVPDATTMLRFRRLLNANKLGEALFARVGKELQARGIKVNTRTIVNATIIGAPSSTKNANKARDPDFRQPQGDNIGTANFSSRAAAAVRERPDCHIDRFGSSWPVQHPVSSVLWS